MDTTSIHRTMRIAIALLLTAALVGAFGCSSQPTATDQPAASPETPATGSTDASPAAPAAADGEQLVNERCSTCHPVSTVMQEDRDTAGWTAIVDDMISRGAQLTPEEKAIVIQYLAENYGPK